MDHADRSTSPAPAGQPPATVVLLDRWRGGDPSAFGPLHDRLSPLLRSRIQRMPGWGSLDGHHQLDDILQEVWARAVLQVKEEFQHIGPGSLFGFLAKVAERTVVDLARKRGAQKRGGGGVRQLPTAFESATSKPGASAPESPTGQARIGDLLRIARDVLNDREYQAWDLVAWQQYTDREASLAMRCSTAAIRSLMLRSRTKIIARMPRDDGDLPRSRRA